MNVLNILTIILVGTFFSILSWWMLGNFFNYLTVYSIIWMLMLTLHELNFLHYYPLNTDTWVVISLAYVSLWMGSASIIFAARKINKISEIKNKSYKICETKLRLVINILCLISSIAILYSLFFKASNYNLINQAQIYTDRISGENGYEIPYIGSLINAAFTFTGVYIGIFGFKPYILLLPSVLLALKAVTGAGRAELIISTILFLSSYYLTLITYNVKRSTSKQIIGLALFCTIIFGTFSFITANRGVTIYFGQYETAIMENLRELNPLFPSIYFYLSGPPGVLNEILKDPPVNRKFGENTFASLYRLAAKMGVNNAYVDYYSQHYYMPLPMTSGTYLRDLYIDFGLLGIIIVPYVIGLASCVLWYKLKMNRSLYALIVLAYIYSLLIMSYLGWLVKVTYWLIPFLLSVVISLILSQKYKLKWK